MKITPFYAAFVCALAGLWACTQTPPSPQASSPGETPVHSRSPQSPREESLFISSDSANASMDRWQAKRAQIIQLLVTNNMSADTIYIVRGFHIPHDEMREVLDSVGPDPTMWGMMGIRYDDDDKPVMRMIFEATGAVPRVGPAHTVYADFSDPCPPNCPKNE